MAVVARLLPRLWDGRRLLQFLTGLALIALAFAAPAVAAAPTPSDTAVIVTVHAPCRGAAPDRIEERAPAERADSVPAARVPVLGPDVAADAARLVDRRLLLPGSVAQSCYSGRAPPLA
ncbi:hypothetical protein AB0M36_03165 [Actinoplanes sp. NPDC051346]|uniref:hypothetical protein n=1 Tax=Actinoplanes sp. NPDC051346 TaxID=3155048 RepID=UPI003443F66C